MVRKLLAVAILVGITGYVAFWHNTAVDASPITGVPQYREVVQTPCLVASYAIGTGDVGTSVAEVAESVDSGVMKLVVGYRYRVLASDDVYLSYNGTYGAGGIRLTGGLPEEMTFSPQNNTPGNVVGQCVTASTCTVSFCKLWTDPRPGGR